MLDPVFFGSPVRSVGVVTVDPKPTWIIWGGEYTTSAAFSLPALLMCRPLAWIGDIRATLALSDFPAKTSCNEV
jgi:hypothetical protein